MSMETPSSASIQTSADPIPSMPAWFGEVALIADTFTRLGLLAEISERVRFARKRFGTFEVVDFVVVLLSANQEAIDDGASWDGSGLTAGLGNVSRLATPLGCVCTRSSGNAG